MEVVKPFLNLDEQVDLLTSRGLIIEDRELAKKILLTHNYYRLSAYSLTLRKSDDTFYPETKFSDICILYDFDTEFRQIIFRYTGLIEVSLRSYIAYWHAKQYGPLGYRDAANFQNPYYHASFIEHIDDLMDRSQDLSILHHRRKLWPIYGDAFQQGVPLWVAVESSTFGILSMLYKNLKSEDADHIADGHYHVTRRYVESWLRCAVDARNVAAHRGRFYNRSFSDCAKLPSFLRGEFAENRTFAFVFAIYSLLPFEQMKIALIRDISALLIANPFVLLKHLDFPEYWKDILIYSKDSKAFRALHGQIKVSDSAM